jgi:hypothetical protein
MKAKILLAIGACLLAATTPAQTYSINWYHIGPGASSAGGLYSLTGGISDGVRASGGNLSLNGGFWAGLAVQGGPTNIVGGCSNQITGTLSFNNANPAILEMLNAPGNEGIVSYAIYAYGSGRSFNSGAQTATNRTSNHYAQTVEAGCSNAGIVYVVNPGVTLQGGRENYSFNLQVSPPVVAAGGGPVMNFAECLGVVQLNFVDSRGAPYSVSGGTIRGYGQYQNYDNEYLNLPQGATQQRLYVHGGDQPHNIDFEIYGHPNVYCSHPIFYLHTNVTVACDAIVNVDIVVTPAIPQYTIVDLGALGTNQNNSAALSVNNSGQIVGYSWGGNGGNSGRDAVFWGNATSPIVDLGGGPGSDFVAESINDFGQIVGHVQDNNSDLSALYWTNSASQPQPLQGLLAAVAFAINNSGQAVGWSFENISIGHLVQRAVVWTNLNSPPLDLGAGIYGGSQSIAYSINDSNQIVGIIGDDAGYWGPAFWLDENSPGNGSAPHLPGVGPGVVGAAVGINRAGQWVGFTLLPWTGPCGPPLGQPAIFYDPNVGQGFLSSPNATNAAKAINTSGQIVGWTAVWLSHIAANGAYFYTDKTAIFWPTASSDPILLNDLLPTNSAWYLESANAINDAGEIVGYGLIGDQEHAFALIPTEPGPPLRITSIIRSGTDLQLSFTSQSGHTYNVLSSADLTTPAWTPVLTGIAGNGAIVQATVPNTFTQPRQFFRIQQAP